MVSLEDLLMRADIPAYEVLLGKQTVQLLAALDQSAINISRLRDTLLAVDTPEALVVRDSSWGELVDLLSNVEANALLDSLGFEFHNDPWKPLKSVRRKPSSKSTKIICSLLGVPLEPELLEVSTPPMETAGVDYGLFDHQQVAASDTYKRLNEYPRRVVLHMPTGSGKTRTAMHVIARHLYDSGSGLVVWLAYSEELCGQAYDEFKMAWRRLGNREISAIRFWGSYEYDINEIESGFVVASLSKVFSRAKKDASFIADLGDRVSLVVMDEAHQAVAPSFKLVLDVLQSKRQDASLLGLTATPGRSWDDVDRDEELANFFGNQKVTLLVPGYENPMEYLIAEGYLAKPKFRSLYSETGAQLSENDLANIDRSFDIPEFLLKRLGQNSKRTLLIIRELEKLAGAHNRIIAFLPSVANSHLVATVLEMRGKVAARSITGSTHKTAREAAIAWFQDEDEGYPSRVLCNYGVLTTGFDAPKTSAVMIARPTKSLVLFSQMIGRGIRGTRANGNLEAEIVTVVDTELPGFRSLAEAFLNWEDAGWQ